MFTTCGILGAFLIVASTAKDHDRSRHAVVALLLMVLTASSLPIVSAATAWRTATFDPALQSLDRMMGANTFWLAGAMASRKWLWAAQGLAYGVLPLVVALAYAIEKSGRMASALVLAGLMSIPCYLLVPAVGPMVAVPGFPWHDGIAGSVFPAAYPRNCFPSLHFAWAMILVMYARRRWLAWLLALYLFLMAVATLGSGEHYAVDLILAVPYCLAIRRLESIAVRRMLVYLPAGRSILHLVIGKAPAQHNVD